MIMMKQLYACVAVPVLGAWYVCVCAYFGMRDCGHVGLGGTMAWWDPGLVEPWLGGTLAWWDPGLIFDLVWIECAVG